MDAEKAADDKEEDTRIPPPTPGSPWKMYFTSYNLSVLMNQTKIVYAFVITFWYLAQFIGAVACVNLYSDVERLIPCDTVGSLANPEESSKVFDVPLLFLSIYHIIEWIRATVLLTIVIIGINITYLWYATLLNTVYGMIAYAVAHMSYFSEDGELCRDHQEPRATWLLVEIVCYWLFFFIFSFPFVCTLCMGKERADATLKTRFDKLAPEDDE